MVCHTLQKLSADEVQFFQFFLVDVIFSHEHFVLALCETWLTAHIYHDCHEVGVCLHTKGFTVGGVFEKLMAAFLEHSI